MALRLHSGGILVSSWFMEPEGERAMTIRLPESLYRRLVEAARADDRSVAAYLRRLLDRELPPEEKRDGPGRNRP